MGFILHITTSVLGFGSAKALMVPFIIYSALVPLSSLPCYPDPSISSLHSFQDCSQCLNDERKRQEQSSLSPLLLSFHLVSNYTAFWIMLRGGISICEVLVPSPSLVVQANSVAG